MVYQDQDQDTVGHIMDCKKSITRLPPRGDQEQSSGSNKMSDFGLRGPKTPWVCPNDRQLALRAKLRTGWSVKTSQFNTYPKPQPLTESEQQMIISVVKKAEELELTEQKRVGKLVDRLESLKKLASGNGVSDCVLCGDSFGLSVFGRSNYRCCDCKKAVCRKCVVELSAACSSGSGTSSKDGIVRLCKICSENRELIKRSGAWFYKGVFPKYILPEKKNHYRNNYESSSSATVSNSEDNSYTSRYLHYSGMGGGSTSTQQVPSGSGSGHISTPVNSKRLGVLWSKSLKSQSECENDSSSGDETMGTSRKLSTSEKFLFRRLNSADSKGKGSSSLCNDSPMSSQKMYPNPSPASGGEDYLFEVSDASNSDGGISLRQRSFERFELSSSSMGQTLQCCYDNMARSSGSSSNELLQSSVINSTMTNCSSPPSLMNYGTIDLTMLYDDTHQALHCTVHSAKALTPTDIDGLADPYCMLKLLPSRFQGGHHRTKTVRKTLNPAFNETLTFYGLSTQSLAYQNLQISVIDDDKWARDCLGFVQIPLHRLKPQQTQQFNLSLENGKLISNEDKEWGRLLLSLSYWSDKSSLVVGLLRAQDLPGGLDHSTSGGSDPFVKVRLIHDTNLGKVSNFNGGSRKYKTGVKWKTANPDFHEEFSFKVSILDLPQLALVISIWEGVKQNEYIGGLVLSLGSKGDRLKHWIDMIQLPNTKHNSWHSLTPNQVPM